MAFGRSPENWLKLQVKYDIERMKVSPKTLDVKRLGKRRKS
jgi:plasmid maintenance system antidote protein VapI